MAKAEKKGGKVCPECGTRTGARAKQCPNEKCNHTYPIKSGGAKAVAAKPAGFSEALEALTDAQALAKSHGGPAKLKALLEEVSKLGGADRLSEALEALEKLKG